MSNFIIDKIEIHADEEYSGDSDEVNSEEICSDDSYNEDSDD